MFDAFNNIKNNFNKLDYTPEENKTQFSELEKKLIFSKENEIRFSSELVRKFVFINSYSKLNKKGLLLINEKENISEYKRLTKNNIRISTYYGLGYSFYGKSFAHKIGNKDYHFIFNSGIITPISDNSNLNNKYIRLLYKTLTQFCKSTDETLTIELIPYDLLIEINSHEEIYKPLKIDTVLSDAIKLWNMMISIDNTIPVFHDVYMKLLDLNKIQFGYKYYICDFYDELSPLIKKIINNQTSKKIFITK